MLVAYSLSAIGAENRVQQAEIKGLERYHAATVTSVKELRAFWKDAKKSYDTQGPQAFVDKLSFIEDKAGKEKILKTLAKLPPLPELESCGETCVEFQLDGKKARLDFANVGVGLVKVNAESFKFDPSQESFSNKTDEVQNYLDKSLTVSVIPGTSLLSDAVAQVCRILVPEARAALPTWAKALIIAVVAIGVAVAAYFVVRAMIKHSERKTEDRIRESERRMNRKIRKMQNHGSGETTTSSTSTTTTTTTSSGDTVEPIVDDGGYVETGDPVVNSDNERGSVRQ